jgi:serine/threonine protein phosphatase PrpC
VTITTSHIVQPARAECRSRAEIIPDPGRTVLALADGVSTLSGGAAAAERFIQMVRGAADHLHTREDCIRLMGEIDQSLARHKACGETTGVIVIIDLHKIFGASIGDSAAWLFAHDGIGELTYGQQPKPLLGSGQTLTPRGFDWPVEEGTLVVASHGLWDHTSIKAVASRVRTRDSQDLALRLAELARTRSGDFPEDVAIITCRLAEAGPQTAS